jgi:hypothetical protein
MPTPTDSSFVSGRIWVLCRSGAALEAWAIRAPRSRRTRSNTEIEHIWFYYQARSRTLTSNSPAALRVGSGGTS